MPFGYGYVRRRYRTIAKESLINEEIRAREMRVISADGEQLGIMSRDEALRLAEEKNLDLVCIAPKAEPPVCKILDYGKYKYDQQNKEKEAKNSASPKNEPPEEPQKKQKNQVNPLKLRKKKKRR